METAEIILLKKKRNQLWFTALTVLSFQEDVLL